MTKNPKEAAAIESVKLRISDYKRQLEFKEADCTLARIRLQNAEKSLEKRIAKNG